MALQIANPVVVGKIDWLAGIMGLSKTAAVERAVDQLTQQLGQPAQQATDMMALLAQLDRIPDRTDAFNPLAWDDLGLPT